MPDAALSPELLKFFIDTAQSHPSAALGVVAYFLWRFHERIVVLERRVGGLEGKGVKRDQGTGD